MLIPNVFFREEVKAADSSVPGWNPLEQPAVCCHQPSTLPRAGLMAGGTAPKRKATQSWEKQEEMEQEESLHPWEQHSLPPVALGLAGAECAQGCHCDCCFLQMPHGNVRLGN